MLRFSRKKILLGVFLFLTTIRGNHSFFCYGQKNVFFPIAKSLLLPFWAGHIITETNLAKAKIPEYKKPIKVWQSSQEQKICNTLYREKTWQHQG